MIPGFNHNIKHQGRIYHVQTEDSGPKYPHIITHLFLGGNILASQKTAYAELLGEPDCEKTVRALMQGQHKQILRNLVNGMYDAVATSTSYALDGPAPINLTVAPSAADAAPAPAPARVKRPAKGSLHLGPGSKKQ